jgi:hypothetical protein
MLDTIKRFTRGISIVVLAATTSSAVAQTAPTVRPLGQVLATSTEPLASVSQVRALRDGRLIVNDIAGRRVLMFDSTLKLVGLIADSTSATANTYSSRLGGLIAFRGDSTLFADPATLSMLVIDPSGKIARTMAAPQPNYVQNLIGGPFGTPGFDARGRLVHRAATSRELMDAVFRASPDSAVLARFNLATRSVDTVAKFMIPKITLHRHDRESTTGWTIVIALVNPLPLTDDWAMLADGTIAIVRGREYRVDFFDEDDKVTSGPRVPFEWRRVGDDERAAIIDSTRIEMEKLRAEQTARNAAAAAATPKPAGPTTGANGRQLEQPEGGGRASAPSGPVLMPLEFVQPGDLPDYRPAFRQGAALGDLDGNLWIRTTKVVNGGAVYDVIDRKGALIDRVHVPPGRVIAGFGRGGVVYMGVVDGAITRMERARVR